MAETLKDINAVAYAGSTLTHFNGFSSEGGELTRYDSTPVGGPPSGDYDTNVRKELTLNLTTRVVGADAAARKAIVDRYARGSVFSGKTTASASGDLAVTGEDVVGKDFIVTQRTVSHKFGENSELSVTFTEKGPTPA